MNTGNGKPRIIPVGEEPPPLEPPADRPTRGAASKASKAKGKPSGNKRGAASRFRTLNAFVDFTARELSRAELLVWLTLFRDCRDGTARTGQADLARRCGVNRRTVYRAILSLQRRGLVQVVRRGRLGAGPSTYRLRWLQTDRACLGT